MAFIHSAVQARREQAALLLQELESLTRSIGNIPLTQTLSDLRMRIYDPFLFVIVGEVKAGKSSFINALLDTGGREICKVAPQPMTDSIQQITYGEVEHTEEISPYLKRVYLPIDVLREVAIVDTPGTNTIVAHHQEVTERFVPAADLIIFVFESKNPYRQSAWDFFDFIHGEWRRKVIFVLQQKDLLSEADLQVNVQGVLDQAAKKGLPNAKVFTSSAKNEIEGHFDTSGFSTIRDYIRTHVTGGSAPAQKLLNVVHTADQIGDRVMGGLDDRKAQLKSDIAFREDIRQTLDHQELRSQKEVELLLENILAVYDKHTHKTERELADGLQLPTLLRRSFGSVFGSKDSPKAWLDGLRTDLEAQLNRDLPNRLQESVNSLSESIQQMAKMVDLKIKNSESILKNEHEIFSDIAERRSHILKELQDAFAKFLSRSENFTDEQLFLGKERIAPNIATGSGVAVIGVVLAALTQGSVLDITGGIVTGVGLLFTGITVAIGRSRLINGYRTEIANGRQRLQDDITGKLYTYIRHIKARIDHNFLSFDNMLTQETTSIADLEQQLNEVRNKLMAMAKELGEV